MFSRLKISKRITIVFTFFPAVVTLVTMLIFIAGSGRIISTSINSSRQQGRYTMDEIGNMLQKNCLREFLGVVRLQALNTSTRIDTLERDMSAAGTLLQPAAEAELNVDFDQKIDYEDYFSHFLFEPGIEPQNRLRTIKKLWGVRGVFINLYAKNDAIRISGVITQDGVCYRYPWFFSPRDFFMRYSRWYLNAVKAAGKTVWSGPVSIAGQDGTVLVGARAVYSKKILIGVVFIFLDAEQFISEILTIRGISGNFFFIDRKGQIIAGNRHGDIEHMPPDGSFASHSLITEKIKKRKPDIVEYTDGGMTYMAALAPIDSTPWSIIIAKPRKDIIAPVTAAEDYIDKKIYAAQASIKKRVDIQAYIYLGIGVFSVILMSMIGVRLSRCITQPLELLRTGALAIGAGDLDTRIEVKTGDELEELADTFNDMTASLKTNIADIKRNLEAEERLKQDLKIAADIQRSLLPNRFPAFPERREFDLYALMNPAQEVGGDFYDFKFVSKNKLYFCVADVSGKGISAAMFMARTRILMRFEASAGSAPDKMLLHVNNELERTNSACMFATVFCAILDVVSGELQYASAGHNPPLLKRHDGEYEYMDIHRALAVGPMVQTADTYVNQKLKMMPGDQLFIYTDGIVEAENPEFQQFTEGRLKDVLNADHDAWPQPLSQAVIEQVEKFADGAPQSDDITILSIKYTGTGNSNA